MCDALAEGVIDVIATDHAPHHYEEKEREFDDAPFGIVGLETAFGVCRTHLVQSGVLTLGELVDRLSCVPARIMGLDGGTLRRGTPADVVVFDPEERWIVDPKRFRSRSGNTPYAGEWLTGRIKRTFVGGRERYKESSGAEARAHASSAPRGG